MVGWSSRRWRMQSTVVRWSVVSSRRASARWRVERGSAFFGIQSQPKMTKSRVTLATAKTTAIDGLGVRR